jgi:hypothetical protein
LWSLQSDEDGFIRETIPSSYGKDSRPFISARKENTMKSLLVLLVGGTLIYTGYRTITGGTDAVASDLKFLNSKFNTAKEQVRIWAKPSSAQVA